LLSHSVSLTREEIRRLVKLSKDDQMQASGEFNIDDSMMSKLDYVQLSKKLGLHRNSLNLMQGGNINQSQMNAETARKLVQSLTVRKKSPTRFRGDQTNDEQLGDVPGYLKNPMNVPRSLKPVRSTEVSS